MDTQKKRIPRKVWMLWFQGVSEAPFVVRKCIDSWVHKNPDWDVIILDSGNINDYVQLDIPEEILQHLLPAHQADLIRLALLSKYGGIWTDATTFCVRPLDEWIDDYAASGFFVFHKPGRDRAVSNWFIAAEKDSPIALRLYQRFRSHLIRHKFKKPNRFQRRAVRKLSKRFNKNESTTRHWFNPIVTKILKIYPYFMCHYMFKVLVTQDEECRSIWENTKRISADQPHLIKHAGLLSPATEKMKKKIDECGAPLFKLTWKYDHDAYTENTLLHYLVEEKGA